MQPRAAMAVVRQKRKSTTEEPQSLLQPSDSCASTLSDTYNPFSKKRRVEQVRPHKTCALLANALLDPLRTDRAMLAEVLVTFKWQDC